MTDGASPARDAAPSRFRLGQRPAGGADAEAQRQLLMTGRKGSATGAAATTAKPVDALTVPDTAWTSRTGWGRLRDDDVGGEASGGTDLEGDGTGPGAHSSGAPSWETGAGDGDRGSGRALGRAEADGRRKRPGRVPPRGTG